MTVLGGKHARASGRWSSPHEQTMTSSIVSVAVAFPTIGGGNVAIAQTKTTTSRTQCYTDDGWGRLRSCSQAFKKSSAKRKKSKGDGPWATDLP